MHTLTLKHYQNDSSCHGAQDLGSQGLFCPLVAGSRFAYPRSCRDRKKWSVPVSSPPGVTPVRPEGLIHSVDGGFACSCHMFIAVCIMGGSEAGCGSLRCRVDSDDPPLGPLVEPVEELIVVEFDGAEVIEKPAPIAILLDVGVFGNSELLGSLCSSPVLERRDMKALGQLFRDVKR
jgi:hypothetical protein